MKNTRAPWNMVLSDWHNEEGQFGPGLIGDPIFDDRVDKFMWNASYINADFSSEFKQVKKQSKKLPDKQATTAFKSHIEKENKKKTKNKHATSFYNLSKDTRLVIPMPRSGKNYATIAHFTTHAPVLQQKRFWKYVAKVIKQEMRKQRKKKVSAAAARLYVSCHGMGVPYFHVRISTKPKYYFAKQMIHKNDRK